MCETTETTQPESEVDARQKLRERWAHLGLVLAGGFWNFFTSPLGAAFDEANLMTYPIFATLGTVVVQPALCAVWGALATQRWIWRLPSGAAACTFLSLTMLGLGAPVDNLAVNLLMFLVCLGGLAVVRWKFKVRLEVADYALPQGRRSSTYGIRYLFLWTSVCAVLAALAKMVAVGTQDWFPSLDGIAAWAFGFLVLLLPTVWLLGQLLQRSRPRRLAIALTILTAPLVTVVATLLLYRQVAISLFWREMYLALLFVGVGAMAAVAVVAMVLRWAGYRIYRTRPA
ncbi:hypothetical protein NG895_17395 [Aeoliella sp. ICT_H6.2]|uniref:Uncharacterized protein n=1 Tax=Aeoliella straminimaris TaxID=2954799 RepID=A0A9X2FB79_9BACT|nr:hypothetical protein [Aeoliella straminimaris]MCO6045675.1 hypothetical protein [Aeoliella straminimaris]